MEFLQEYENHMQGQSGKKLDFQRLEQMINESRRDLPSQMINEAIIEQPRPHEVQTCTVNYFNEHARKFMKKPVLSGLKKFFLSCKGKSKGGVPDEQGGNLVTYALVNATAIQKFIDRYDQVHGSTRGQLFKSQAQSQHKDVLRSPWLFELVAFHINLREAKANTVRTIFARCSLILRDEKPSLTCKFLDSIELDIELTCSICMDTLYDAISLTCGHVLCYICACDAASVTIVDGLKTADLTKTCPLCRKEGVYTGAVKMKEINSLIRRRCKDYWTKRHHEERVERMKKTKQHWLSEAMSLHASHYQS